MVEYPAAMVEVIRRIARARAEVVEDFCMGVWLRTAPEYRDRLELIYLDHEWMPVVASRLRVG